MRLAGHRGSRLAQPVFLIFTPLFLCSWWVHFYSVFFSSSLYFLFCCGCYRAKLVNQGFIHFESIARVWSPQAGDFGDSNVPQEEILFLYE